MAFVCRLRVIVVSHVVRFRNLPSPVLTPPPHFHPPSFILICCHGNHLSHTPPDALSPLPACPLLYASPSVAPTPCSRSAAACRSHTPGSPLDQPVSPPHPSLELQTVARLLTAGPCGSKSFRSVCGGCVFASEPVCAWRASLCVCVCV